MPVKERRAEETRVNSQICQTTDGVGTDQLQNLLVVPEILQDRVHHSETVKMHDPPQDGVLLGHLQASKLNARSVPGPG